MPVHQGAWRMGEAISSVLDQRTSGLEILDCDD